MGSNGQSFGTRAPLGCHLSRADPDQVSGADLGYTSDCLRSCTSPPVHHSLDPAQSYLVRVLALAIHRSHCPTEKEKISNSEERSVQATAKSVRVIYRIYGTKDCFKSISRGRKLLTGELSML